MRLHILASLVILASLYLLYPMAVGADESLVLCLSFDGLSGTEVRDFSEYGNNGELRGEPELVDGRIGKALWFDGIDDWVEIPDSISLRVSEEVTVMAWINTERHEFPGAGWQGIIAKSNWPTRSYSFYTEWEGHLHFSIFLSEPQFLEFGSISDEMVPLQQWVHVAAVAQTSSGGGIHRYYINGDPVGEWFFPDMTSLPGDTDTEPVLIGRTWEDARFFLGYIDEVRIWNRALDDDEIGMQVEMTTQELLLSSLPDCIEGMDIHKGIKNSLIAKVDAAYAALERGMIHTAVNILQAFMNEVEAQSGKKLSDGQAERLVSLVSAIIDSLYGGVDLAPGRGQRPNPGNKLSGVWGNIKMR